MTGQQLLDGYLAGEHSGLIVATVADQLVGHSFFVRTSINWSEHPTIDDYNHQHTEPADVSWITQLVVDSNCRHKKIAQTLIYHSMAKTIGCGLITSHPFAVRALE